MNKIIIFLIVLQSIIQADYSLNTYLDAKGNTLLEESISGRSSVTIKKTNTYENHYMDFGEDEFDPSDDFPVYTGWVLSRGEKNTSNVRAWEVKVPNSSFNGLRYVENNWQFVSESQFDKLDFKNDTYAGVAATHNITDIILPYISQVLSDNNSSYDPLHHVKVHLDPNSTSTMASFTAGTHILDIPLGTHKTDSFYVVLDILSHEMGHYLQDYYIPASRQLNVASVDSWAGATESAFLAEGYCDILSLLIEHKNQPFHASLPPSIKEAHAEWYFGEDAIIGMNKAGRNLEYSIRDFKNPHSRNLAGYYGGDDYTTVVTSKDEYYANATLLSHIFYLLSTGGTGKNYDYPDSNPGGFGTSYLIDATTPATYGYYLPYTKIGPTNTGIGIEKAGQIAMKALLEYHYTNDTYSDALDRWREAAGALGFDKATINTINDAFKYCGIFNGNELFSSLIGPSSIKIKAAATYSDAGVIFQDQSGNDLTTFTVTDNVQPSIVGNYTVSYKFFDPADMVNEYNSLERNVEVVSAPPVLTLNGSDAIYLPIGTVYNDAGATAIDVLGNDISSLITSSGTVDNTIPGKYEINYTIIDCGETVTVTRTIIVLGTQTYQSVSGDLSDPYIIAESKYALSDGFVSNVYTNNEIGRSIKVYQLPQASVTTSSASIMATTSIIPSNYILVGEDNEDGLITFNNDAYNGSGYVKIEATYFETFETAITLEGVPPTSAGDGEDVDDVLAGEYKINPSTSEFPSGIDYLVITSKKYEGNVQQLVDFRKTYTKDVVTNPSYIVVEDIYDEYISGDITEYSMRDAIHSFVTNFYVKSPSLKHIFIVGDASDPDRINGETIIPSSPSRLIGDEWFYLGREDYPADYSIMSSPIAFGRICPDTKDEVEKYVEKVINYEEMISNGFDWKNNVLISADNDVNDANVGEDEVYHEFDYFTNTDPFIPKYINKKHVFMSEYAKKIYYNSDSTNVWEDIIGDEEDFIKMINDGAFLTMFQGHSWSHGLGMEQLFTTPAPEISSSRNDPMRLKNNGKPTFMLLGGCDIGNYSSEENGIETRSLAEQVTLVENGGAIAVVAAINEVYSEPYSNLFGNIIKGLYGNTLFDKTTLGSVFNKAKNNNSKWFHSRYNHVFNFYGDPAITFKRDICLDENLIPSSINNNDVIDLSANTISEELSAYSLTLSESLTKTTFNTHSQQLSYLNYGDAYFSDFSHTSPLFTTTGLPDGKGRFTATYFGVENDYILSGNNVQFFNDNEFNLSVKFRDEGHHENNFVKPRILIENNSDVDLSDFVMYYYFSSDKTPILKDWYSPYCTVTLESIDNNNYRVKYDYTGYNLTANSVLPDAVGNVGGIHYEDWSYFEKNDDYSYISTANMVINDKITIYKGDELVYGNPLLSNMPPVAVSDNFIEIDAIYDDEYVTLYGDQSYDPDGIIVSYKWYFENTLISTLQNHVVNKGIGNYVYTLIVMDNDGAISESNTSLSIKSSHDDKVLNFEIGPNPVPANTPITIRYDLPDHYASSDIKVKVYRAWDTQLFSLDNTPGLNKENVFWEWTSSYFGGSDIGKIEIIIDGIVVNEQAITFTY